MSYCAEFPRFILDVVIPEGFKDSSWHNDVCPSWEKEHKGLIIKLWIDYLDFEDRELGNPRFVVCLNDEETDQYDDLIQTDNYQEALDCIATITK